MDPTSITLFSIASAAIAIIPTIVLIVQHIHKKRINQSNISTRSGSYAGCTEANRSSAGSDISDAVDEANPCPDDKVFRIEASTKSSASDPVPEVPRPPPPTRAPSLEFSSPSRPYPLRLAPSPAHHSIPPSPPPSPQAPPYSRTPSSSSSVWPVS